MAAFSRPPSETAGAPSMHGDACNASLRQGDAFLQDADDGHGLYGLTAVRPLAAFSRPTSATAVAPSMHADACNASLRQGDAFLQDADDGHGL